jgi:hypothetical protein
VVVAVTDLRKVMRGSVRDNVLMGQPYDAEFMGEVGACYVALFHCYYCVFVALVLLYCYQHVL